MLVTVFIIHVNKAKCNKSLKCSYTIRWKYCSYNMTTVMTNTAFIDFYTRMSGSNRIQLKAQNKTTNESVLWLPQSSTQAVPSELCLRADSFSFNDAFTSGRLLLLKKTSYKQGSSSPPPWTQVPSGELLYCSVILELIVILASTTGW